MSARVVLAPSGRVFAQLRHDPRTVALLIGIPVMLVALVRWIFLGQPAVFQRVGVPLLGIFPLTSMFLVTSVTMLRERTSGTLERLLTTPVAKLELLAGDGLAFGKVAILQGIVVSTVSFGFLGLEVEGAIAGVVALAVLNAILGTALGLLVSGFARSEVQAGKLIAASR